MRKAVSLGLVAGTAFLGAAVVAGAAAANADRPANRSVVTQLNQGKDDPTPKPGASGTYRHDDSPGDDASRSGSPKPGATHHEDDGKYDDSGKHEDEGKSDDDHGKGHDDSSHESGSSKHEGSEHHS